MQMCFILSQFSLFTIAIILFVPYLSVWYNTVMCREEMHFFSFFLSYRELLKLVVINQVFSIAKRDLSFKYGHQFIVLLQVACLDPRIRTNTQ